MTAQISNAELGRRIAELSATLGREFEKLSNKVDDMPGQIAQDYLRRDVHGKDHILVDTRLEKLEAAAASTQAFRRALTIAIIAAVVGGLCTLAAVFH